MRAFRAGLLLAGLAAASFSVTSANIGSDLVYPRPRTDSLAFGPSVERLIVFIGSSACLSSTRDSLRSDLRVLGTKVLVKQPRAAPRMILIGVSVDYDVKAGTQYLNSLYPFQEIVAGRGFLNSASSLFILGQVSPALSVPQIVVLDRMIQVDSSSISVQQAKLVRRVIGADSIHAWVSKGAPF